jgi:hypothetical protein
MDVPARRVMRLAGTMIFQPPAIRLPQRHSSLDA